MDLKQKALRSVGNSVRYAGIAVLLAGMSVLYTGIVSAEDLSDNETCLECHSDGEWTADMAVTGKRVHNDDGSMAVEEHEMWSCVDCHTQIEEIPHKEDVERAVDCLDCHDAVPE